MHNLDSISVRFSEDKRANQEGALAASDFRNFRDAVQFAVQAQHRRGGTGRTEVHKQADRKRAAGGREAGGHEAAADSRTVGRRWADGRGTAPSRLVDGRGTEGGR